jgi:undecaprenyl-diphosphatase
MIDWDLEWLQRINHDWSHPVLDRLMPAVSAIDAWIPLIALAVILVLWRGQARARIMLLCLALALGIGDGIVSKSLKSAVGRVRPRDALNGVIIRDLGKGTPAFTRLFKPLVIKPSKASAETRGKSFPSSHTVNLFAAATVVAWFYRGWGLALFGLACTVGWSRIYCGAHWPSDIPPSAGLGVALGCTTVLLVQWAWRRRHPAPALGGN